MVRIFGIRNCATMKKAFAWCDQHGVDYEFHDYRKSGVPSRRLLAWCRELGWQTLVNTRGTTWRKLDARAQAVATQAAAVALMLEHPSLIKRPVIEVGSGSATRLLVGFDPQRYAQALTAAQ